MLMGNSSTATEQTGFTPMLTSGRYVLPALGLAWANCINMRIFLARNAMTNGDQPGPEQQACTHRTMHVLFAPHLPPRTCAFTLSAAGISGTTSGTTHPHTKSCGPASEYQRACPVPCSAPKMTPLMLESGMQSCPAPCTAMLAPICHEPAVHANISNDVSLQNAAHQFNSSPLAAQSFPMPTSSSAAADPAPQRHWQGYRDRHQQRPSADCSSAPSGAQSVGGALREHTNTSAQQLHHLNAGIADGWPLHQGGCAKIVPEENVHRGGPACHDQAHAPLCTGVFSSNRD